jgi:acyl carrier protein
MKRNLLQIINEVLENNGLDVVETINDVDSLRDDLGFDSLMLAELTVEIESEYDVDIFDDGLITQISQIRNKLNE